MKGGGVWSPLESNTPGAKEESGASRTVPKTFGLETGEGRRTGQDQFQDL